MRNYKYLTQGRTDLEQLPGYSVDGELDLTCSEFNILYHLAKRPGWVFTRSQIVNAVRGDDYPVTERAVDVQIVGLRRKMGGFGELIETVRGIGYRFTQEL